MHKLTEGPCTKVSLSKNDALHFYRQMIMIRRLEDASNTLYKAQQIRGFCHLYSGQEACAVGMKAALRPHDDIISAYRCHGWASVMGAPAAGILCELTGHVEGLSRGKAGSIVSFLLNGHRNLTNCFLHSI